MSDEQLNCTSQRGGGTSGRAGRARLITRVLLAGPLAAVASLLFLLAMPLWYPPGPAMIDNIVVPILVFPLIWAVLFFHACLDRQLWRVAVITVGVGLVSAGIIAMKFLGLAFQA